MNLKLQCRTRDVLAGLCAGLLLVATAQAQPELSPITRTATNTVLPGKMVWADLLTGDVEAAAAFYRDVFGWTITPSADNTYLDASLGGTPVAAISAYDADELGNEGIWLASFSVPSVDVAVKRALAAGGKQLAPTEELPGRGRVAVVQDPQGAVLGVMRATGGDPRDGGRRTAGEWLWPELWSPSPADIVPFYREVFRYQYEAIRGDTGIEHHVLGRDSIARASIIDTPLPKVEPNWLLYLLVDDMQDTLARVRSAGGQVLLKPTAGELGSLVAIIADPTGGVVGLQTRGEDEQ